MKTPKKNKLKKFLDKEDEPKALKQEGELVETINKTIIVENDGRQLICD